MSARLWSWSPARVLALGLGSGLAPVAPGTFGTVVGVLLYLPLAGLPLAVYLGAVAVVTGVGVWAAGQTARELGVHDHPAIVWDEVAGYLVTMTAAPSGWLWVLAGFALFRLFDIAKPWPVSWADRKVAGGLGIMLDDLLAGLYAAAALQLLAVIAR